LFNKFVYEIVAVAVAAHGVRPAAVVPLLVVSLAVVVPDVVVVNPTGFALGSIN